MTSTYRVGNAGHDLRQAHKCDSVKPLNGITNKQTNKQINLSLDVTIIKMTNMRFILLLQNNLTSEFSAYVAAEMT
jgi:hypothetical protein